MFVIIVGGLDTHPIIPVLEGGDKKIPGLTGQSV